MQKHLVKSLHKNFVKDCTQLDVTISYKNIKPGSLLQSTTYFPINKTFFFKENKERHDYVDLCWLLPKDFLVAPKAWPVRWALVPMDKLPLKDFSVPPMLFTGKVFSYGEVSLRRDFAGNPIIRKRLRGPMLELTFFDKLIFVPQEELESYKP